MVKTVYVPITSKRFQKLNESLSIVIAEFCSVFVTRIIISGNWLSGFLADFEQKSARRMLS